jgi:hypothetical protein
VVRVGVFLRFENAVDENLAGILYPDLDDLLGVGRAALPGYDLEQVRHSRECAAQTKVATAQYKEPPEPRLVSIFGSEVEHCKRGRESVQHK